VAVVHRRLEHFSEALSLWKDTRLRGWIDDGEDALDMLDPSTRETTRRAASSLAPGRHFIFPSCSLKQASSSSFQMLQAATERDVLVHQFLNRLLPLSLFLAHLLQKHSGADCDTILRAGRTASLQESRRHALQCDSSTCALLRSGPSADDVKSERRHLRNWHCAHAVASNAIGLARGSKVFGADRNGLQR